MKLSRIDIIGLNGGDGLHYQEVDILERLEGSTKINGAYPKDVADAIDEIKRLREMLKKVYGKSYGKFSEG